MPRWEPNAPERLALAALDLFAANGYESTTVIEIAERAGLTKSTFFRHFRDKREVLFGAGAMPTLLSDAITSATDGSSPLQAIAAALEALGAEAFRNDRRPFVARRRAVIAANSELREREALKQLALTDSMVEGLRQRGVPKMTARVAAELGALALAIAYDRWTDPSNEEDFGDLARQALDEVRRAGAAC